MLIPDAVSVAVFPAQSVAVPVTDWFAPSPRDLKSLVSRSARQLWTPDPVSAHHHRHAAGDRPCRRRLRPLRRTGRAGPSAGACIMMSMFRTCREQAQSYRAVPVGSADAPGFSRSVGGGGASLEAEVRYPLLSGTSGG